jgi:hypothetical protein
MSFTYDPGLSTTRDKLRALLRDIDRSDYLFEDEELDGILAQDNVQSDLHAAAAEAWRRVAQSDPLLRRAFGVGSSAPLDATERTSLIRLAMELADKFSEAAAGNVGGFTEVDDLDDESEWTTWQEHAAEMLEDKLT